MSVRRLAEADFQPTDFKFGKSRQAEADAWIKKYPEGRQQSAVIPLLMLVQEQEGWVTKAGIEHVAAMLKMPLIRVLEVATFYTQFQLKPVGTKAHIQICGTTPCMLMGSEALLQVCRKRIHPEPFATNESGTLSWEEVECQGACVNAPMVMISRDTYEDLTPERLEEIIDAFESGKGDSIKPGSQIERLTSAPRHGLTSLKGDVEKTQQTRAKRTGGVTASVPPAKAGKPRTEAAETDPTIKSPSRAKGPGHREASKNGRSNPDLQDAGPATSVAEPSKKRDKGTTMELAETAKAVRGSKQEKTTVDEANPTVAVTATAAGRAKPKNKATGDDANRPAAEDGSRSDDLKLISGVGPKIEKMLHSLGIYTYSQIASWKRKEREWVDDHLKFRGRIEREDWVRQAKVLEKGGRSEYRRVFGKEPK